MSALSARYLALPRALRWAIVGGTVIAGYFLVVEPVLNATDDYRARANALATELEEQARLRGAVAGAARAVEQTAAVFGRPAAPEGSSAQQGALERRISTVFTTHRVANQRASYRDPAAIGVAVPLSLVGPNQRLERLAVELSFECDLPTLLAVLADLEKAPEVAALGRLSVRKSQTGSGRNRSGASSLIVNLAAEGWLIGGVGGGRPAARGTSGGEP